MCGALAACTTDSNPSTSQATATSPSPATSPSVQRSAGGVFANDVIFKVTNRTQKMVYVRTCMDHFTAEYDSTCENWGLSPETSLDRTGNNTFAGVIVYSHDGLYFNDPNRPLLNSPDGLQLSASNPEALSPFINWWTEKYMQTRAAGEREDINLVQGESQERTVNGHTYSFERAGDETSGVKNLIVVVKS